MQVVMSMFDKGMGSFRDVHSIESAGTSGFLETDHVNIYILVLIP